MERIHDQPFRLRRNRPRVLVRGSRRRARSPDPRSAGRAEGVPDLAACHPLRGGRDDLEVERGGLADIFDLAQQMFRRSKDFRKGAEPALPNIRLAFSSSRLPGGDGWQSLPHWLPQEMTVWSAGATWILPAQVIAPVPPLR